MTNKIISLTLSLCCLAFSVTASAQSVFDIEFIFFKRIDRQDNAAQVKEADLPEIITDFSLQQLPDGFSALQPSQFRLEGVYRRLQSSQNLRPLVHFGWRQPLMDKADTPWLHYAVTDSPEEAGLEEFSGMIRFSRNQGLLVENQVIGFKPLRLPETVLADNIEHRFTDSETVAAAANPQQLPLVDEQMPEQLHGNFVLSESRKVKLEELHYFDHPNMGILLKVTPYKASLEEQEALQNP